MGTSLTRRTCFSRVENTLPCWKLAFGSPLRRSRTILSANGLRPLTEDIAVAQQVDDLNIQSPTKDAVQPVIPILGSDLVSFHLFYGVRYNLRIFLGISGSVCD